jgi:hypothetical protein
MQCRQEGVECAILIWRLATQILDRKDVEVSPNWQSSWVLLSKAATNCNIRQRERAEAVIRHAFIRAASTASPVSKIIAGEKVREEQACKRSKRAAIARSS